MSKRDFLSLSDLSLAEARQVFAMTAKMKQAPKGSARGLLSGRAVAVVLEKASTRTRVSFEVGISQLGAHPITLTTDGSQIARGEPIKDTARVLSGYCDLISFRTFATARLKEMASFATVPVINALSDDGHPVQVLCDVMTVEEQLGAPITGKKVAFVGDCSSNMARSWVEAARIFDFHLALAAPEGYFPPDHEVRAAGDRVSLHRDAREAIRGCEVVNTDVWASMGQEAEAEKRRRAFAGWTIDAAMLEPAASSCIVLHCLPAHRGEEIDDATIEGPRSRVFPQAENRLHVQKGLMCFLLGVSP
ncbi:MAG: ornithine carbamoyltransferase [Deltaproteobacteria bacterium]|nr:ornithine carbamoyltransferase [Deltaproteobacteria bacterium]